MPTSHSIALLSLSHARYSLSEREAFSLSRTQCSELEEKLLQNQHIKGALVLSTCNRTEILLSYEAQEHQHNAAGKTIGDTITSTILDYLQLDFAALENGYSLFHNEQAFQWLVKVSSGLQSQIIGEAEVFGQFKQAFNSASVNQHLDSTLQGLCETTIRATKDVRAKSKLGSYSVSIAKVAANRTQIIFEADKLLTLILIGSGENNLLLLRELIHKTKRVLIVSRSSQRTQASINSFFADSHLLDQVLHKVTIIAYQDLEQAVRDADVIVASTTSKTPLLTYQIVTSCRVKQPFKPLFILDLSVPRNIESTVADIDGVFLYNLDHISDIQNDNQNMRFQAALAAEKLVATWVEHFRREALLSDSAALIKSIRAQIMVAQEQTVKDLVNHLGKSIDPEDMLKIEKQLTLSNAKLLHQCTLIIADTISSQHVATTSEDEGQKTDHSPANYNHD